MEKNANFDNFESALHLTSGIVPFTTVRKKKLGRVEVGWIGVLKRCGRGTLPLENGLTSNLKLNNMKISNKNKD